MPSEASRKMAQQFIATQSESPNRGQVEWSGNNWIECDSATEDRLTALLDQRAEAAEAKVKALVGALDRIRERLLADAAVVRPTLDFHEGFSHEALMRAVKIVREECARAEAGGGEHD